MKYVLNLQELRVDMGFDINETITTKLHYKDIALIAVAIGNYQEQYGKDIDEELLQRMINLVNRLGEEVYNTSKD